MPNLRVERDVHILEGIGKEDTLDIIASREGVERSTVYRTVQRAKQAGAIRTATDIPRFLIEERGLQIDNRQIRIPHLIPAAVVHVPEMDDNILHRILGYAAALELGKLLQPGDKIGIGSGQGMLDFTRAFTEGKVTLPYNDLEIYSLVGNLPTYEDAYPEYRSFAGADEVVFSLANLSSNFKTAELAWRPPYSQVPEAKLGLPAGIDIAVFGLGTAVSEFAQIPGMVSEKDLLGYHPFLEYLNRIAVVNIPADMPVDLLDRLKIFAEKANSLAIGPDDDFLRNIPVRIGIAGGLHKLAQIRYAVASGIVNYLVIDNTTASRLVSSRV